MDLNQNVNENVDTGTLSIHLTNESNGTPVQGAKISISYTGNPSQTIEEVSADDSGNSEELTLNAPPLEYSMEPSEEQPYAEYTIRVQAPGYRDITVSAINVLPGETAIQNVRMETEDAPGDRIDTIVIAAHTLYAEYPPKIPEEEIKPMNESGEIVLSRVVIPEYIVVHDGVPDDASAQNYYVKYRDYIKNVVSSEVYATWEENAIYANALAVMSFTLNRVYTEWYRGKGYPFTITSSTAYDQNWIYGRNIYSNIDRIIDSIFANYLSRPGVRQPILTSYCDGRRVTCNGLSQWGSQYLAGEGYTPIEILRYYYGNDMYINTAESISGVPSSYPGYALSIGSSGEKVRQLQNQLNRIAQNYPAIPIIAADGIYGPETAKAVRAFQKIFNLEQTGVTDYPTWYSISNIYVGVTRIAEP